MKIIKKLSLLFVITLVLMGCSGENVRGIPGLERVIHCSIQSSPLSAEVYWRVVSLTPEVRSTNRFFLGRTPYRETRTLMIPGLSKENALHVSIVIEVEKNGFVTIVEKFNALSLLGEPALNMRVNLERN